MMVVTDGMVQFALVVAAVLVLAVAAAWAWARRRWALERAALACSVLAVWLAHAACRATPGRRVSGERVVSWLG
ncbi:hypothetical protein [Actinomyces faecalis]|uniref:hypothetical protein n=1 Tax=Actinomyces faecalis TaxID=2722820 RepID=UPI0015529AFA|nr:hypothetical protein [Actinomyces faecalis]